MKYPSYFVCSLRWTNGGKLPQPSLEGSRKCIDYKINTSKHWLDESFEIKLRNRKGNEEAEVRIIEHLYRGINWTIAESSFTPMDTDAKTMEFRVKLAPNEERTITY